MLKHKISLLEASNAELQRELQERRTSCEHLSQRALDAQVSLFWIIGKSNTIYVHHTFFLKQLTQILSGGEG